MSSEKNNRWKDYLLRSSLPLEQIVAEKLERSAFHVGGEYPYTRLNEHGVETEFSIDLHAFDIIEPSREQTLSLNVLVECKYTYPGTKWIFSPHPEKSVVIMGCINYLEDLCTYRLDNKDALYQIDRKLEHCTRGIELHSKGADPNTISRGLHQLRYAAPNLVSQECQAQLSVWNEVDLAISCICPILVTTASLHTLKPGLNLSAFQSAGSLDNIAEEVEALIVYREPGPQLHKYCSQQSQTLLTQGLEVRQRLEEFDGIMGGNERVLPLTWALEDHFVSASKNILVVRLDALDHVLTIVRRSVSSAAESSKRVASLAIDLKERTRRIVPLANT